MSIRSIGTRLVKGIGTGNNFKQIVSDCIDGKTYTNIVDSNGKLIATRTKMITREVVGNKKVNTVTKVTLDPSSDVKKSTYDRVYDNDSKLLGTRYTRERLTDENKFVKELTAKQRAGEDLREYKVYYEDGTLSYKSANSSNSPGDNYLNISETIDNIDYNKKGLPCSDFINPDNNMTLKEMRTMHITNNPQEPYAHPSLKLGHLDDRVEGSTINKLDQYI